MGHNVTLHGWGSSNYEDDIWAKAWGRWESGYVDTWKTFSPIVINIAMLFILFTLPEREMVGIEDKAEHGFDLVLFIAFSASL